MKPDRETQTEIGPRSRVSVATLVLVLAGVLGGSAWCSRVENKLEEIRVSSSDRWPKRAMRAWAWEVERLNAGFKAPDVDDIMRRVAEHDGQGKHPRVALGQD